MLLLFALSPASWADDAIYRYTDVSGVVHYTDRAPDRHVATIRFAPISGAQPGRGSPSNVPIALRDAASFSLQVESPTPGQQRPQNFPSTVARRHRDARTYPRL